MTHASVFSGIGGPEGFAHLAANNEYIELQEL